MKITKRQFWVAVGFVIMAILFVAYQYPQWFISSDQQAFLKRGMLIVADQPPGPSVMINYATLPFAGFVVVRNDLGDRPGSIIGVSSYLEAGRYKSIRITLQSATVTGQALIAGLVTDDGSQRLDAGDQLLVDARGKPLIQSFLIGTPAA